MKNNCTSPQFALLSHVLPPSPSGQAVVLYHLLSGIASYRYILLSCKLYNNTNTQIDPASEMLPAKYLHLKPGFQFPSLNCFRLAMLSQLLNLFIVTYNRARQIYRIINNYQCKSIIVCTGDIYNLPAAFLAVKRNNCKLIPYLFDDFIYQWTGLNRIFARLMEPIIMRHISDALVPNEFMQQEYFRRYRLNSTVIYNPSSISSEIISNDINKVVDRQTINIIYTGAIYHAHYDAFRNLIKAMELNNKMDLNLHIYTAQSPELLKTYGIYSSKVIYHSHISNHQIPDELKKADILFLPLGFDSPIPEVIKTSAPGKTGEYLSAGKPILVHAPKDTFISWYFRKNNCGVMVEKKDPFALMKGIEQIATDNKLCQKISQNARSAAIRDFNVEKMRVRFRSFISSYIEDNDNENMEFI
jgi:glycosyltransferase involved in cell wall biosynthesis